MKEVAFKNKLVIRPFLSPIRSQKKWDMILEFFMIGLAAVMAIPVYYLLVTTFKTPAEAIAHPLGLPDRISFDIYIKAWKAMEYPKAFRNSFTITASSVFILVILSSMAAFPLARRNHRLNRILFFGILAGIMIPYHMALIPLYKLVISLKLMNTLIGVILIVSFTHVPFSIFLFTGFIRTIPAELDEAAYIDGCSVFRTFWSITFPLLRPAVATVIILESLGIWNDFLTPLLFLQGREKAVILLEVFRNIGQFSTDWTNLFPMMVLAIAPMLIFYMFMQKYIIKGIASGAVKG
ncbi:MULTISPECIES: carbohydrate ABC transporter permease [unclassified Oceanispirochaeta]|uniref:carbohydrate ABC transporter permease n=1 Tax=unclassified Oceanispirochaeta TaxID=2635722 RepID=UPI001E4B2BBE|nr:MULTISPECIES: carbohydrate ABC transporter permease [unclassified Oceanispirochaeta]